MKLSHPQLRVLENLNSGLPASDGLCGRSAHGGLAMTLHSLRRRRLIDTGSGGNAVAVLTAEGRRIIESEQIKENQK